jgi:DNA replication and repair protein RecF
MINDIRLQHFRSYSDAFFELDQGVNIVVGPNASGKTNLLEALMMVARGYSYRVKDTELIQFNAQWSRLDATLPDGQTRTIKLKTEPVFSKVFEIGGQSLTRLHPTKTLPVVLFEPNHLLLMSGSPDLRRSFLDDLIEQSETGFGAVRRHYRRVLAQRNALLKKNPPDLSEQLFVWNVRLSELGGQIAKKRAELVRRFAERTPELYAHLAARNTKIELQYQSRFSVSHYESQLLHKLESSTELDLLRGFTAYGPHRDDLQFLIDGHPMQESASRGETRTLVLALKIMELQLLEEVRNMRPLLLLDDVFSELDAARRSALTEYAGPYQTLITTTDADIVSQYFKGSNRIALTI